MNMGNNKTNNLVYRKSTNKYFLEEGNFNEKSVNNAPATIASQIVKKSVVLDVGCAQGTLGSYLSSKKDCLVYGIEIDSEAREIAKKTKGYKDIFSFSIEDTENGEYKSFFKKNIKFDYIIFADVLEHLYNPDKVIFEFQKLLSDNGKILVSIPNVAHYDIICGLMKGIFNYSKVGILDNTHIRFFTKKSFAQFIDDINDYYKCNLDLEFITATTIIPEYADDYVALNRVIYAKKDINVLQNIFSISKGNGSKLKKILLEKDKNIFSLLNKKLLESEEKDNIILKQQEVINDASNQILEVLETNKQLNLQIEELNKIKNSFIVRNYLKIKKVIKHRK